MGKPFVIPPFAFVAAFWPLGEPLVVLLAKVSVVLKVVVDVLV